MTTFKHLISAEDLSSEAIYQLIEQALKFKHQEVKLNLKQEVLVSNLFFENSTRTHRSFEVAETRLGLKVIQFEAATSSTQKGESLYDTVLTMDALGCEILVIRHPQEAFYQPLIQAETLNCSIINGGDGTGQHPTQTLLDVVTIFEEYQTFTGLKIAIAGDIKSSRVARSNAMLLKRMGAELIFCAPDVWYDPFYDAYGKQAKIDDILQDIDVLMLLRVQHERHEDASGFSTQNYHEHYGLTLDRYQKLKPSAIVMHPAPVNRDVEIASSCVEAPQSRIVAQMRNGVYMRMAILEVILKTRGALK